MPRAEYDSGLTVTGIRATLIDTARATLARLTAGRVDWYDFGDDHDRQRAHLEALTAGDDVLVYRFELPRDVQPLDHRHAYTLRADRLVPAEYERVAFPH